MALSANTAGGGLFPGYQSPQSTAVPPQTVQLLLEKGHRPAERVHTINASHCASPADAADKGQIAIKEDVREGKDEPEYSFATQGEATPSFTRIFHQMAKV